MGLKSPGQVESGRKRKEEEEEGNLLGTAARTNGGGRKERSAEIGFFLPPSLIPFFRQGMRFVLTTWAGSFSPRVASWMVGWVWRCLPPPSSATNACKMTS